MVYMLSLDRYTLLSLQGISFFSFFFSSLVFSMAQALQEDKSNIPTSLDDDTIGHLTEVVRYTLLPRSETAQ